MPSSVIFTVEDIFDNVQSESDGEFFPMVAIAVISAAEEADLVDAPTFTAQSVISAIEVASNPLVSGTASGTSVITTAQSFAGLDQGTDTASAVITALEVQAHSDDAATVTVTATHTAATIGASVDTAIITAVSTMSAVIGVANSIDSGTLTAVSNITSLEAMTFTDTNPATAPTTRSAIEAFAGADASTATGAGVITFNESYGSVSSYTDSLTVVGVSAFSSVDGKEFIDSGTISAVSVVSGLNTLQYAPDIAVNVTTVTIPGSTDIHTYIPEATTVAGVSVVSGATVFAGIDAGTMTAVSATVTGEAHAFIDAATPTAVSAISSTEVYPTLIRDSFTRTSSSTWNSPEFSVGGLAWVEVTGASSLINVNGSAGTIGALTGNTFVAMTTDIDGLIQDINSFARIQWTVGTAGTASQQNAIVARYSGGTGFFLTAVQTLSSGKNPITLRLSTDTGATTILDSTSVLTDSSINTNYNMRLILQGQGTPASPFTGSGTFWLEGTSEPAPQVSYTSNNSTLAQFSGTTLGCGIRCGKLSGVTSSPTYKVADFLVTTYP